MNNVNDYTLHKVNGLDDPYASNAGRELIRFFMSKTGGSRLLTRQDFSPVDIKKFLPNVYVADIVYDEFDRAIDAKIRVSGTQLDELFGNVTNMSLLEHPSKVGVRGMAAVRMIVNSRNMVVCSSNQLAPEKPYWGNVSLFVPIVDEDDRITQFFCHVKIKSNTYIQ